MDNRKGHPPRLQGWDYTTTAAYFVTFNVKDRICNLSSFYNNDLILTELGCLVKQSWERLPNDFPNIDLIELLIMPDHVHSVIFLKSSNTSVVNPVHTQMWPLMSDERTVLGKVIRTWKARSTKLIREQHLASFAWQTRFYERIIRDETELLNVTAYIRANPERWLAQQQNEP